MSWIIENLSEDENCFQFNIKPWERHMLDYGCFSFLVNDGVFFKYIQVQDEYCLNSEEIILFLNKTYELWLRISKFSHYSGDEIVAYNVEEDEKIFLRIVAKILKINIVFTDSIDYEESSYNFLPPTIEILIRTARLRHYYFLDSLPSNIDEQIQDYLNSSCCNDDEELDSDNYDEEDYYDEEYYDEEEYDDGYEEEYDDDYDDEHELDVEDVLVIDETKKYYDGA